MSGFVVTKISCELSKPIQEQIDASTTEDMVKGEPVYLDGQKYKEGIVEVEIRSSADVTGITEEEVIDRINKRLKGVI